MALPAASWTQFATLGGSLLSGTLATLVAVRARASAHRAELALQAALARERAHLDAAHAFAAAARESTDAVREELVHRSTASAQSLDGVLVFEETDESELRCSAASGERFGYYPGMVLALDDDESLPVRALTGARRVRLGDAKALHPADADALAVPLITSGPRRCAVVFAARRRFDEPELERLVTLADQAAPAFGLAADRERDRHRAEYDGLTGLLTPRAFRARLAVRLEAARFARGAPLALVFLDTDRFKRWNDTYGHACGDALLREIARILRAEAGPGDLAARNGGDEFCVIFADTGKARAAERAERLRSRIAALDVRQLRPSGSREDIRISASLGIAVFPADASSSAELLECADAAMYHAKHTGRDGVAYRAADGFARLEVAESSLMQSSAS